MPDSQSLSFSRQILSFISKHRGLLFILLAVFVLRLPSLMEPHRYADEEIYLTLGQGLRKGLVFYRDIHDNKPPLLYFIAALAGNIFWFRFFLLVVHAIGVIIFWKLAELVFNQHHKAVFVSTSLFAILSTLPLLEGNIANGENFMIIPALAAVFLLYRMLKYPSKQKSPWLYPLIGVLFATAFLFKIPIVFDFLGILLFWVFLSQSHSLFREWIRLLVSRRFMLVLVGFAFPVILSIAYYAWLGAFEPYVRSALLQNIGYLSSWRSGGGVLENPLVWRGLIIAGISAVLFALRQRLSRPVLLTMIWTVFSLYGALLSSRPYPHYLLEPLVPVSLLVVFPFLRRSLLDRISALVMMGVVGIAYVTNGFWYYKTLPYYQHFLHYATGAESWEANLDYWGARRNYQISEYIQSRTSATDRIFIWGTEPAIYALSDRLPVGRYTVSYHIIDFRAFDETLTALKTTPAKFIVVIDTFDEFNNLKSFLDARYNLETVIDHADIYRLREDDTQAVQG
ncbi:MAG: hypothetical protein A2785_03445 [Candidatus Chisholmbacteria bacterium RIFCSPHIGHO2_01_FULL_49_18]|uniref:Glycosyltransferase RgtA/B/C/D-like domain-containing protein n=2 Tax=Candidatus Chisholmiibacteriota TaxID=1817900 RepID=A0A1G1VN19_9BACT|nr:MAG: hypothetical protein A2785_03445 [Candidatus Chisholmbacteria bacterium RIFCSPHIGHO2_01_FULL_49_18]OGY19511.1 MAG: hypothetical protein A3A65_06415 [Candidatus Chisholmbacteria bacterium RIFCSPLOWO2_01_FULL_49_14]